jgi:hypothetical protein
LTRINPNYNKKLSSKFLISLIIIAILIGSFYAVRKISHPYTVVKTDSKPIDKINIESYRYISSQGIDSILYTFGVKTERITTRYKDGKVLWFTKNAEIPKTLNTTKINLEITDYLRSIGLNPVVTEDIRTKNITFTVYNDTNNSGLPLAKIYINHETKK